MSRDAGLDGPHWTFALELYGREGIQAAFLHLQDRFGVDVNVLLICLYGASRLGVGITTREVTLLDESVATWRAEIVEPLRSVRRGLKSGAWPAPRAATEGVRDIVKRAELRAEQIEQAVLAGRLDTLAASPPHADGPAVPALRAALDAVTAFYAARLPKAADVATADGAIETILRALGGDQAVTSVDRP